MRDLKKRDDNFSLDSWNNANFWGEAYSYWSQKDWETKTRSVRRGIYENTKGHYRFIGKFDSRGKLLSGLGISTDLNGNVYAGNIKVKSINSSSYNIFYNGKGSLTDSSGNIKSGTWENDQLVGSYELTDMFGNTKNIKF